MAHCDEYYRINTYDGPVDMIKATNAIYINARDLQKIEKCEKYVKTDRGYRPCKKPLTGIEFNKKYPNEVFVKLVNESGDHNGFKIKVGLNDLKDNGETFDPYPKCRDGGLFFCKEKDMIRWLTYRGELSTIYKVTIPNDEITQVVVMDNKIKTNRMILSDLCPIEEYPNFFDILRDYSYKNRGNKIPHRFKSKELAIACYEKSGCTKLKWDNYDDEEVYKVRFENGLLFKRVPEKFRTEEMQKKAVERNEYKSCYYVNHKFYNQKYAKGVFDLINSNHACIISDVTNTIPEEYRTCEMYCEFIKSYHESGNKLRDIPMRYRSLEVVKELCKSQRNDCDFRDVPDTEEFQTDEFLLFYIETRTCSRDSYEIARRCKSQVVADALVKKAPLTYLKIRTDYWTPELKKIVVDYVRKNRLEDYYTTFRINKYEKLMAPVATFGIIALCFATVLLKK